LSIFKQIKLEGILNIRSTFVGILFAIFYFGGILELVFDYIINIIKTILTLIVNLYYEINVGDESLSADMLSYVFI